MKRRWMAAITLAGALCTAPAFAAITFVNGGFENNDLAGWTVDAWNPGSETWTPGAGTTEIRVTGSYWGPNGQGIAAVTNVGTDARVPISMVYNGAHAVKVGDERYWGGGKYQYSRISQTATVTGEASDPNDPGKLFFAWAAVLEQSFHSSTQTPFFQIEVLNKTKGTTIYDVHHYEGDGGAWTDTGSWFYSNGNTPSFLGWTVNEINLAGLAAVGDELTLRATARDCNPTGHAMYVYLDGFGGKKPDPRVPEPGTLALLGGGLVGLVGVARRKGRK